MKFKNGFVIKSNSVNALAGDPGFGKTIANGVDREVRVVLDSRESLFLGRSNDLAVFDPAGRRIMVIAAKAEDLPCQNCRR